MKITISKHQWEKAGKKAGLIKSEKLDKTASLGLYEGTDYDPKVAELAKQQFEQLLQTISSSLETWRTRYRAYGAYDTASVEIQNDEITKIIS